MANQSNCEMKLVGAGERVLDLWNTLQQLEVNSKNVWLDQIAEHYGIDWQAKHISVRGHVYFAELDEDKENDRYILTLCTETAWNRSELFDYINEKVFNGECDLLWRETECGCNIFCVHDPNREFFDDECCVSAYGGNFEEACEDTFHTIKEAIDEWSSKTGIKQGERTQEEMVEFINGYEYDDDEAYFYINPFEYVD